jgi:hypothetical protein
MTQNTEEIDTLKSLIERVHAYQKDEPDAKFCKRWGKYIGTADKWRRRLLVGDFGEGTKIPQIISDLRELLALFEGTSFQANPCKHLLFYKSFMEQIENLESEATDRRIVVALGAIGIGKTYACHGAIQDSEARRPRVLIIIPDVCREKSNAILTLICKRLGLYPNQPGGLAMFNDIKSYLIAVPQTVIFDEAHQGGVALMRIIKDLVNQTTSTGFVYCALKTEYERVETSSRGAICEARQFMRRCRRPMLVSHADGTFAYRQRENGNREPGDAAILIREATGADDKSCIKAASTILKNLTRAQNLSSLADAIDALKRSDVEPTPDNIANMVKEMFPTESNDRVNERTSSAALQKAEATR